MNAKITLSHSDFHRYKIKGFSEAQDFFKWKSRVKISDSFKKIVVVGDEIMPYTDDNGIYFTGLFDFLLKDEWL